jgi:transposase
VEHIPNPQHPDLALQLPADVYYRVVHDLRAHLPPPEIDTPEEIARRDNAAIAKVAALLPVNAAEADLARQAVSASTYAADCLRLACQCRNDPKIYLQSTAQSASQQRQSMRALTLLQRMQAERRRQEADAAVAGQNAWTEHIALSYMAAALDRPPLRPPATPEPPPPAPAEPAEPQPDPVAEADFYARLHPRRAAEIRRLGGLPSPCTYGPPEEPLLRQLVHGRTPTLLALDAEFSITPSSHPASASPAKHNTETDTRPLQGASQEDRPHDAAVGHQPGYRAHGGVSRLGPAAA